MGGWFNRLYTYSMQWNYYAVKKNKLVLFIKTYRSLRKTINEKDAEQNGKISPLGGEIGCGREIDK